jgi:hypothetical protein
MSSKRDDRQKRDLHALNEDGMVVCNPHDKEAAHRAEVEGIATYDHTNHLPQMRSALGQRISQGE